jgi:hypothetical protein
MGVVRGRRHRSLAAIHRAFEREGADPRLCGRRVGTLGPGATTEPQHRTCGLPIVTGRPIREPGNKREGTDAGSR